MTPNTSHFSPPHQQEHPALTNSSTSTSSKLPFRCSICHRSFKRPYGLDRHMKLHDPRRSEFEIHCSFPFCKYKSLQRSNVKNHFNSVHKKVKHICQLPHLSPKKKGECGLLFSDAPALIRHEKMKHNYFRRAERKKAATNSVDHGIVRTSEEPDDDADQEMVIGEIRREGNKENEGSYESSQPQAPPRSSISDTDTSTSASSSFSFDSDSVLRSGFLSRYTYNPAPTFSKYTLYSESSRPIRIAQPTRALTPVNRDEQRAITNKSPYSRDEPDLEDDCETPTQFIQGETSPEPIEAGNRINPYSPEPVSSRSTDMANVNKTQTLDNDSGGPSHSSSSSPLFNYAILWYGKARFDDPNWDGTITGYELLD